jgi:hypothetical protein
MEAPMVFRMRDDERGREGLGGEEENADLTVNEVERAKRIAETSEPRATRDALDARVETEARDAFEYSFESTSGTKATYLMPGAEHLRRAEAQPIEVPSGCPPHREPPIVGMMAWALGRATSP